MSELRRHLEAAGRAWIPGEDENNAHRAIVRWMDQATAEIELLQGELETERKQRKEADATLDSMLWNATS